MKRAGGDKENVLRPHESMPGIHGCAFYDGQDVALNAFAAHIGTMPAFPPCNLVDLIEKYDPVRFDTLQRDSCYLIHVDELLLFFLHQVIERLGNPHTSFLGPGT